MLADYFDIMLEENCFVLESTYFLADRGQQFADIRVVLVVFVSDSCVNLLESLAILIFCFCFCFSCFYEIVYDFCFSIHPTPNHCSLCNDLTWAKPLNSSAKQH